MSIDYYAHVGPYIKIHNPKRHSTEEYHSCPNEKCSNHVKQMSEKFCPKCGTEIKLVAFPVEAPLDVDFYGKFEEKLCEAFGDYKPHNCDDYVFLIGNTKTSSGASLDIDSGYEHEVKETDPATELEKFKTMFAKEIDTLKEIFGEKAIEVKWGILGWVS